MATDQVTETQLAEAKLKKAETVDKSAPKIEEGY